MTNHRALNTRPWFLVEVVATMPTTQPVKVMAGGVYELRTDAQVVDEETGAVSYPMAYVTEGAANGNDMAKGAFTPFHKLDSVVILAESNSLLIGADVVCSVWVLQARQTTAVRAPVPGGGDCGCGCKGKGKGSSPAYCERCGIMVTPLNGNCGACGTRLPQERW